MGRIEKISIALPTEMLDNVKEAVASGQYASTSEVVREALRGWEHRQIIRQVEIERLRKAWKEGLESGPGSKPLDMEDIKRRGREQLAKLNDVEK